MSFDLKISVHYPLIRGLKYLKFCADIHGFQMTNPNSFGNLLTRHLVPQVSQRFHKSTEIFQHLLDGLA